MLSRKFNIINFVIYAEQWFALLHTSIEFTSLCILFVVDSVSGILVTCSRRFNVNKRLS